MFRKFQFSPQTSALSICFGFHGSCCEGVGYSAGSGSHKIASLLVYWHVHMFLFAQCNASYVSSPKQVTLVCAWWIPVSETWTTDSHEVWVQVSWSYGCLIKCSYGDWESERAINRNWSRAESVVIQNGIQPMLDASKQKVTRTLSKCGWINIWTWTTDSVFLVLLVLDITSGIVRMSLLFYWVSISNHTSWVWHCILTY